MAPLLSAHDNMLQDCRGIRKNHNSNKDLGGQESCTNAYEFLYLESVPSKLHFKGNLDYQ